MRRRPGGRLEFARSPLDDDAIVALGRTYLDKGEHDREKLERMIFYAQTGICRWKVLLGYFGETLQGERCGRCDNCVRAARRERAPEELRLRIPARKSRRREYAAGDAVRVPRYGEGRVRVASGDEVTVEFANGDVRTFLRSYVRRSPVPNPVDRAA